LVAAIMIVYVVGLSTWYAPFGWFAWGPRLMVPLLPAMLLISCVFATERAGQVLRRFMAGRVLWPAALLLIALGVPEITVLYRPGVMSDFFASKRGCVIPIVAQDTHAYYRCFDFHAWHKTPLLLQDGLKGLGSLGGSVSALVFVGAVIMVLHAGRINAKRALVVEPSGALPTPAPGPRRP
jgi:hypothetical protein